MSAEAFEQYSRALKAGQKYYRGAVATGSFPYPTVLDDLTAGVPLAGNRELGTMNVPADLIAGTKSAGRAAALAGNFMPLLPPGTEFASKWMALCDAHLEEGIRDPVKCFEYMGRFYVQEGNKRVSVLMSFGAPVISAQVTRVVPALTGDPAVRSYYEFMDFFALAGLYGVIFSRPGGYRKLQAALGMDPDHVWTEQERSSFSAGFHRFRDAFEKQNTEKLEISPADALLVWLQVFPFSEIKDQSAAELSKQLTGIWPDVRALAAESVELNTKPVEKEKGLVDKLLNLGRPEHLKAAFIYAFDPEESAWTRDHDRGREYLEEKLGEKLSVTVYRAYNQNYLETMQSAVEDGAEVIFATTTTMIGAARRIAAQHSGVRVLVCALSLPYTGVRMYYSRSYEAKFITGAIAGAMAENDAIGYIANYPIVGTPASINAFALGARMVNPRAKIHLRWSCLEGNPVKEFLGEGITVISNRDTVNPKNPHWAFEWGVYRLEDGVTLRPLAYPVWNWGPMYEQIIRGIFNGDWDVNAAASVKAVNYWWGLDSGVIDVKLSQTLPDGVYSLARLLKNTLAAGQAEPFRTRILDQDGVLRNDGSHSITPEERMSMDWLCDNVLGRIPEFDELLPQSQATVRLLGLHRDTLPPEKAEAQL